VTRADDAARAERYATRAEGVARRGLEPLSDDELLELLDEHRWAVGRLARRKLPASLRSVLNAAVLRVHGRLHPAAAPRASLGHALRRTAKGLAVSTLVFVSSVAAGWTLVAAEPAMATLLAPRPMLASMGPESWGSRGGSAVDTGMTFFYWSNNLRASLLALGLGTLAGVPAMLAVAFNGALLGAVGAFASTRGAGLRLVSWILPHGVPELGALVLCGALGWTLGLSWLEPGPRRRRAAFAQAGRDVTPLVVVAAVLVLCAAPLEGFVAPLDLPWAVKGAIPAMWVLVLGALTWRALRADRSRSAARVIAGSHGRARDQNAPA
jgi:uncharacterized membrane protein SpoIIM required for sporulation